MSSHIRDNREDDIAEEVTREAKNLIEKIVKDVGKDSATQQLIMGCASGWLTGYLMVKVGKVAAMTLGGGIILLKLADHQGLVRINWDKLYKKADEMADAVESSASKKGPKLLSKVERFVDRKIDKVEATLKKKERKVKSWYHRNILDEDNYFVFQSIHIFMASFFAGMAVGLVSGRII